MRQPIIGQEAICPHGLGRVKAFCFDSPFKWIQVSTYVDNNDCKWDSDNVTLVLLPQQQANELSALQAEVDALKCCGNCKHK